MYNHQLLQINKIIDYKRFIDNYTRLPRTTEGHFLNWKISLYSFLRKVFIQSDGVNVII